MKKPKVILIGEHPHGFTGNSHYISELLRHIDDEKFDVSVFAGTKGTKVDPFGERDKFQIIEGFQPDTMHGDSNLSIVLENSEFDVIVFVGLDLWAYARNIPHWTALKKRTGFKWVTIFPYDIQVLRQDWVNLLKPVDFPCVYSEYGYNMLKNVVPNVRYFRPPLYDREKFIALKKEERMKLKGEYIKSHQKNNFVFGFFGANMFRKDPQRLIKAFFEVKKEFPDILLYMHTEMKRGDYNLEQYLLDCGKEKGDVYAKMEGSFYDTKALSTAYNIVDCYVSPSMQEGLNWTVLEAMLCGTPVIASHTTAHKELLEGGAGLAVKCDQLAYLPLWTDGGVSWVEARTCDFDDLVAKMKMVVSNPGLCNELRQKGFERAKEWLSGVSNINDLLTEATTKRHTFVAKENAVLFVQHSSAGDVLMSTQTFKGLKERHKNKPLVYMTQKIYQDIVEGNPYIDKIIDYDESLWENYSVIYNPHGDKILPGGWNNLDVTLYSMYPYFCKVEPDKIFIEQVKPAIWRDIEDKVIDKLSGEKGFILFHTTGGHVMYRTYAHMNMVVQGMKELGYKTVQVGGRTDMLCEDIDSDLRGHLSWRETAWVMSRARAAVVIDSFPSHLAGALEVPAVVLFGPAPARVTQPRSDHAKLICLQPNMLDACEILSHCWGSPPEGKFECMSPCINTISPFTVIESVKEVLGV